MSKREECRGCGAKLKHDKTSDQYDPEYCSGKCRKGDGAEPYVKTPEEQAAVIKVVSKTRPATLEDYEKNVPSKYARRFEPEKLNWSKNVMNEGELKQAGFRANSEPIPGDWDYGTGEARELPDAPKEPTEYELLKEKAKVLDIKIFGKTKEVLAAEIAEKEAENA
jgi:hypothetical protein